MANSMMAFLAMFLTCNSRRYGHSLSQAVSHSVFACLFYTVYQFISTQTGMASSMMAFLAMFLPCNSHSFTQSVNHCAINN